MLKATAARPRVHWWRTNVVGPGWRSCRGMGAAHHHDETNADKTTCELCQIDARRAGVIR
jgi:hypothetical protein